MRDETDAASLGVFYEHLLDAIAIHRVPTDLSGTSVGEGNVDSSHTIVS
jgi:hypothetical protein